MCVCVCVCDFDLSNHSQARTVPPITAAATTLVSTPNTVAADDLASVST